MQTMTTDVKENAPELWLPQFPWPKADGNKYDRGHAIIAGGDLAHTGAAKLAARAALRVGAGLVSIACETAALPAYAAALEAIMTKTTDSAEVFSALIQDPRVTAVMIGPACGVTVWTRERVLLALAAQKNAVLDADALTVFATEPTILFNAICSPCILTPHEGEFVRLFPMVDATQDRIIRATQAAALSHAVIILKGHETVVAAPDGRVVINKQSTPFLATAGSGDVLSGLCAGLLAQGMEVFDAACAAVWLHGAAGNAIGAGLVAEDLPATLPLVLNSLRD